jgi:hypothetical protein
MSRDRHLPTLFGRAGLVFDGHTTLKDSARALRDLCGKQDGARVAPDTEMLASIDGFAERVLAHFALEEGGSYFGTLAEDSPQLVDQVAHLKGEHRAMRADLHRLRASAEARPRPSEFPAELGRFLDRFEAHEQHENAVLEKFFLEEAKGAG